MNAQKIAFDLAQQGETNLTKFVEAGAALAKDHTAALSQIIDQVTISANATVKRMGRIAEEALRG